MLNLSYFILYIVFFYFYKASSLYTGEVSLDDFNNKLSRREEMLNEKKKISAVLFFADTVATEEYNNYTGLEFLKLDKKTPIKHCMDYPGSIFARKKRHSNMKKRACTCYARLQDAIMSLLNYAQNNLGMVTALGSISNHSFSNSIRFGNAEINDRYETANAPQNYGSNEELLRNDIDILPAIPANTKKEPENPSLPKEPVEKQFEKVPLLNVFPKDSPPPLYAFNDEEERRKRSEGPYILEPEHREVFHIMTKRDVAPAKPKEISDAVYLNRQPKVTSIFDIMDIMSNMQRSLFGTMLQDESDNFPHDGVACPFPHNILGRMSQPGLFEVVQKTLFTVINSSDGFLMIIIGGNLSDIASPYTPLVQSIKHVVENTDEHSTLIVLTGTCPNSPDSKVKVDCEELNKKNLPLFASGPGSEEFSNCYELYDVPLTVKRILARYNSNEKEALPQDIQMPELKRFKRKIIDLDDEEEDYDEDEEVRYNSKRAARVTGGGSRDKAMNSDASFHINIYLGIIYTYVFTVTIL